MNWWQIALLVYVLGYCVCYVLIALTSESGEPKDEVTKECKVYSIFWFFWIPVIIFIVGGDKLDKINIMDVNKIRKLFGRKPFE